MIRAPEQLRHADVVTISGGKNEVNQNNMKRFFLIELLMAIFVLPSSAQELLWQQLNETLPVPRRIIPVDCRDNNHQEGVPNEGAARYTQDLRAATIWHSAYSPVHRKVEEQSPAELVFEFKGTDRIDRMVYVPRQDGNHGNVTLAEVYVKTQADGDERLVGRFNWLPDNEPKTVCFKDSLCPLSVRFRVLEGVGQFASCAEMEFMQDERGLKSSLFADDLLTRLNDGITQDDVNGEPSPLLRELARQLHEGTYPTAYRLATYDCYNSPRWLAEQWKTPGKCYDQLQGVTGILMEPGKHLIAVSGLGAGQKASLKVVAWYTGYTGRNFDGHDPDIQTFALTNGVNVINYNSAWNGLAYIAYFSDGHAEECPPISVHFVGGTVNGYLSPDKTDEQMHEMTAAAPSRFIDLVSSKVHAVWSSAGMHEFCKGEDGRSPGYRQYMNILDTLMTWEQRLVGFEKYELVPPNRTLLYVNFTYGALFQGGLGISSHIDNERSLLNCQALMHNDSETIWGLSHEWGHQHQVTPYFCWGGMAEVSNNINSYHNVMKMGYRYDQIDRGKRRGLERAVKRLIDEGADECILQSDDPFERLSPFLQLYKYFTYEGGKPDFWPDLYQALRHSELQADDLPSDNEAGTTDNVVPYVLNFVRQTSLLSGYNLLPYFERFGVVRVTQFDINDYGHYRYHLTQAHLDSFRRSLEKLVRKKKLLPMPAGMIEEIAHAAPSNPPNKGRKG